MVLCRYLRWKGRAEDLRRGEPLQEVFVRNAVPYSCLQTTMPWGPDDELAAPEACDGSRPCYGAMSVRSS